TEIMGTRHLHSVWRDHGRELLQDLFRRRTLQRQRLSKQRFKIRWRSFGGNRSRLKLSGVSTNYPGDSLAQGLMLSAQRFVVHVIFSRRSDGTNVITDVRKCQLRAKNLERL